MVTTINNLFGAKIRIVSECREKPPQSLRTPHGGNSFSHHQLSARHNRRRAADIDAAVQNKRYLLDILHLRTVAGLGVGLFVGITDSDDVVQLIALGDVKAVEEELAFLV